MCSKARADPHHIQQNTAAEEEDGEEDDGGEEEEGGEESDEMEEDEETAAPAPARRAKPKKHPKKKGAAPVSRTETALSEQLMAFLGTNDPTLTRQEVPRYARTQREGCGETNRPCFLNTFAYTSQVMKRMVAYIKEKELPKSTVDKRKYVCDDALQELLGVKSVNMFGMNK